MEALKISIPQPCQASWEHMSTQDQGRFCGLCQKSVIDFTTCSDEEIKHYFSQVSGRVCGRFKTSQLQPQQDTFSLYTTLVRWYQQPALKSIVSLVVAGTSLLFSCTTPVHTQGEVMGDTIALPKVDTSASQTAPKDIPKTPSKEHAIMGKIKMR